MTPPATKGNKKTNKLPDKKGDKLESKLSNKLGDKGDKASRQAPSQTMGDKCETTRRQGGHAIQDTHVERQRETMGEPVVR